MADLAKKPVHIHASSVPGSLGRRASQAQAEMRSPRSGYKNTMILGDCSL
jgi:hypothetical protein